MMTPEQFAKAFHSEARVHWINRMPCCVSGCSDFSVNAHVKTRNSGGTWRDIFNICWIHHEEQHKKGIRTFARKYGIDPWAIAARLAERWDQIEQTKGTVLDDW